MCYRISNKATLKSLEERYGAAFVDKVRYNPYYHLSAFSHPAIPIITTKDPSAIDFFQWGLIPHWEKSYDSAALRMINTVNARGEELSQKSSFRDAWDKSFRCIIPVTGFFESHTLAKEKGKPEKIPYHISVNGQEIFSLAGIFNTYIDKTTGAIYPTFTILTVGANLVMKRIHNLKERMPLIIPQLDETLWLDNEVTAVEAAEFIKPYPADGMKFYTVYKDLHSPKSDSNCAQSLEHFSYDESKGVLP